MWIFFRRFDIFLNNYFWWINSIFCGVKYFCINDKGAKFFAGFKLDFIEKQSEKKPEWNTFEWSLKEKECLVGRVFWEGNIGWIFWQFYLKMKHFLLFFFGKLRCKISWFTQFSQFEIFEEFSLSDFWWNFLLSSPPFRMKYLEFFKPHPLFLL